MRPPVDTIPAPPFPVRMPWVNVGTLKLHEQRGRPVLIEFWDFCRVSSLRTLAYVKAWHERYEADGLRVVSVHCPGLEASRDDDAVRDAVARLGIEHPVLIDTDFKLWSAYDNEGWPARYLFDGEHHLREFHYGEGAYAETEQAIQELLGVERELLPPLRPEDAPEARLVIPTPEQPGAYSGPYEAGGAWAVLSGSGTIRVHGREIAVTHPGAHPLVEHDRHEAGVLDFTVGDGVTCHLTTFTPGVG
jgi:hypothetical protein